MIAARAGAKIDYLPNPRNEAEENNLHVPNDRFLALELESITLGDGLMEEVTDIGGAVSPSRRREGRLSGPQTTRA
jgi:UDP-sulfoquinovose synthase